MEFGYKLSRSTTRKNRLGSSRASGFFTKEANSNNQNTPNTQPAEPTGIRSLSDFPPSSFVAADAWRMNE